MRLFTVLDATLARPVGFTGQTRLWIAAPGRREARALLADRGIAFREDTFAGPVDAGPFMTAASRCGLLDREAVFAYPVPHSPRTTVWRVEPSGRAVRTATAVGDLLGAGVR